MKENMNARCHCGHRLSQHKSSGDCCMCGCDRFTESVNYHCPVCKEPILIRYAPNAEIERLRYTDDGSNYIHVKCKAKLPKSPFKRPSPPWVPNGEPKPRTPAKQAKTDEVAFIFSMEKLRVLVAFLGDIGAYDPSGEVDEEYVTNQAARDLLKEIAERNEED